MNTRKKITKALVILVAIFVLSMIFAALDSSSQFKTAYDFGFRTGQVYKEMIKILGLLGLFGLAFGFLKKKESI